MSATITYRFDKDFPTDSWIALFRASEYNKWWTHRNAEAALAHRYLIITAWDGDTMVGMLSVESDGVNAAGIDDVVVHPSYRGRGIGSDLMRRALDRLSALKLDFVQLLPIPG